MKWILRSLLIVGLFGLISWNQRSLDETKEQEEDKKPKLLLMPKRGVMKVLSFGHGSTAADLLFVQALNYVLRDIEKKPNPRYLNRLFETMVALDPQAESRYTTGALFLSAVAQRHQAALNLLEKADGRAYTLNIENAVFRGPLPQEDQKEDWLDFKQRLIHKYKTVRSLHPDHPRSWMINRSRSTFFITTRRDNLSGGREFLAGSKAKGLTEEEREAWRNWGNSLVKVGNSMDKPSRLYLVINEYKRNIQQTSEERLKASLQKRLNAVQARFEESMLEIHAKKLVQRKGVWPKSLEDMKRLAADQPNTLDFIEKLDKPYAPDSPEDYVFFPDGRIRSPTRVVFSTQTKLLERFRNFQESNNRRFPKSFKEMGIDPEKDLPKEVRVSYDSATGEFEVLFQKR
ncbi:MAG: hypothetical protein P1V97_03770 [Planctomycetota bacterium]|nr:hypothetical protein [Planctomycetota bacterium]